MQSRSSIEFHVFSNSSNTSHSIYLRVLLMTVLAVHSEATMYLRGTAIKTVAIN